MSKYRNQPVEIDGIRFDSKAEARRYQELILLERAGEIKDLVLQPRFPIAVKGKLVCTYVGDFQYWDRSADRLVCEDVKGMRTAVYKLKKKLLQAALGIEVREIAA